MALEVREICVVVQCLISYSIVFLRRGVYHIAIAVREAGQVYSILARLDVLFGSVVNYGQRSYTRSAGQVEPTDTPFMQSYKRR